jgi:hypothetical protein
MNNNSKCYVKLKYGIANQIFQLAAGYAYAKKHNKDLILDPTDWSITQGNHPFFYANTVFSNFNFGVTPQSATVLSDPQFSYIELPYHDGDVVLSGLWQSQKYFQECTDEFISKLKLPEPDCNREDYNTPEVAIHIRRGDYMSIYELNVCDTEYFNYYFEKYKDCNIKVYTDSPNDVREEFASYNFDIVTNDLDLKDLARMTQSDILIGSNSTFSWWASCIGKQECYFPIPWFKGARDFKDVYRDDMNLHIVSNF